MFTAATNLLMGKTCGIVRHEKSGTQTPRPGIGLPVSAYVPDNIPQLAVLQHCQLAGCGHLLDVVCWLERTSLQSSVEIRAVIQRSFTDVPRGAVLQHGTILGSGVHIQEVWVFLPINIP